MKKKLFTLLTAVAVCFSMIPSAAANAKTTTTTIIEDSETENDDDDSSNMSMKLARYLAVS